MKKVIYSVSRFNKFGNNKLTGIGFITEKDLIIACVSQKGNAYIRVFEDCIKNCHARYSCERQTEQSIEGQLRICNEFAERNDLKIVDTYIDRAMTGTNDHRPEFQRMLSDSDKPQIWDIVLVYALDRFGRNSIEVAVNKQRLKKNNKILISATQRTSMNIDGSKNLDGIILENVMIGYNNQNGHNSLYIKSSLQARCHTINTAVWTDNLRLPLLCNRWNDFLWKECCSVFVAYNLMCGYALTKRCRNDLIVTVAYPFCISTQIPVEIGKFFIDRAALVHHARKRIEYRVIFEIQRLAKMPEIVDSRNIVVRKRKSARTFAACRYIFFFPVVSERFVPFHKIAYHSFSVGKIVIRSPQREIRIFYK